MGFGTLFFGYFLLLNLTYYTFTDILAALIIAMGLNKLSFVNRYFKNGFYTSLVFAAIGLCELVLQIIEILNPRFDITTVLSCVFVPRYFVMAVLTLFILLGIESVAKEVGLSELARRARTSMPFSLGIYCVIAVLEVPSLVIINITTTAALGLIMLLALFVMIIINLVTIYKAYAKICMPEDRDNDFSEKPSKFGFVNKYREHTQEKQREYAEYRLEKMKKKASRKKKK